MYSNSDYLVSEYLRKCQIICFYIVRTFLESQRDPYGESTKNPAHPSSLSLTSSLSRAVGKGLRVRCFVSEIQIYLPSEFQRTTTEFPFKNQKCRFPGPCSLFWAPLRRVEVKIPDCLKRSKFREFFETSRKAVKIKSTALIFFSTFLSRKKW